MEVLPGLVGLALHVAASTIFLRLWGETGVGPAFAIGMTATALSFFFLFSLWVNVSLWRLLISFWAQPLACAVPCLAAGALVMGRVPATWLTHRAGLLLASSMVAAASGIVFLVFWIGIESRRQVTVWSVLRGRASDSIGPTKESVRARTA